MPRAPAIARGRRRPPGPERSSGGAREREHVAVAPDLDEARSRTPGRSRAGSRGTPPASSHAWHVPSVGWPANGSSAVGREDPDPVVRARLVGRDDERRLGQVRPAREPLHRLGREPVAVEHDRERVAEPGLGREHVDLRERASHGRPSLPRRAGRSCRPMTVIVPTLRWERPLWRDGATRIVGVDEVGVAPTSGAVVAAAVIMPPNCHRIPGVRDSKTLTRAPARAAGPDHPPARDRGRRRARRPSPTSTGSTSTTRPTSRCAARSPGSAATTTSSSTATGSPTSSSRSGPYTAIVDGDARVYSIACASVVAKVVRDRMMAKLACPLPGVRLGPQPGLRDQGAPRRRSGPTGSRRTTARRWQAIQVLLAGDQLGLFDEPEERSGLPGRRSGSWTRIGGQLADEIQALGDEALAAIG